MPTFQANSKESLKELYSEQRRQINSHPLSDFVPLQKSHGSQMFCCPVCGSGTKKNKTGALKLYPPSDMHDAWRVICFSNFCFGQMGTDTLGALRILNPGQKEYEIFRKYSSTFPPQRAPQPKASAPKPQAVEPAQDISLNPAIIYLQQRGITPKTCADFGVRYEAKHFFPALQRATEAVIIPYPGEQYWIARSLREKAFDKPKKNGSGGEPLFNHGVLLSDNGVVFVVESQICALTLSQLGVKAIALGNCGGSRLLEYLQQHEVTARLVLCLDNDPQETDELTKGPKAQKQLYDQLVSLGVPVIEWNIAGSYKDPNDALQGDADGLQQRVREALRAAADFNPADHQAQEYSSHSALAGLSALHEHITALQQRPYISSGFPSVDAALSGGFIPGLYTVGAITSLGKTSFILQVCDQMAQSGTDVLFFSLEMSRFELMSKSISRTTFLQAEEDTSKAQTKQTALEILTGAFHGESGTATAVRNAEELYSSYAEHIWIIEGDAQTSVETIRSLVSSHIKITKRTPVVVIDYVQILTPLEQRMSDKQNTDRNVLELKRLSRDFSCVVIGISSLNRDNYTLPINLAAYKETGAIEYGSDCLIGLQYTGMDYVDGENEKQRERRVRALFKTNENTANLGGKVFIDFKVLKNRNGAKGRCSKLLYAPKYNAFQENREGPTQCSMLNKDPFNGAVCVPLGSKKNAK